MPHLLHGHTWPRFEDDIYLVYQIPVLREEIVFLDHNEKNGTINALRLGVYC